MENEHIMVAFDKETGYIKNLVSKETGVEFASDNYVAIPTFSFLYKNIFAKLLTN